MSDNPHSLSERRHPYLPGLWLAAGFLGLASLAFLLRPVGVTPDTITEKAAMASTKAHVGVEGRCIARPRITPTASWIVAAK